MKRDCIIIWIIFLLIAFYIFPTAISQSSTSSKVIIVDDEGDGDYITIEQAINNAVSFDTIEVYSGLYKENLRVGKPLIINGIDHELGIGNDFGKPIVDACGNGDIFYIHTSHVNINGFLLQNCTTLNNYAINIWYTYSVNISNNNITKNWRGINIYESSDNIVSRNYIYENTQGLTLFNSQDNNIYRNVFENQDERVIEIWNSHNNKLHNNTIIDSRVVCMALEESKNNHIFMNNFLNNHRPMAVFTIRFLDLMANNNVFYKNYWNRPRILPKPIIGLVYLDNIGLLLPWFIFDRRPALIPNDIGM